MGQIPYQEAKFHPHSFADSAGRLFEWNGQFYRGIRVGWEPFVRQLFRDGVIEELVNRGLLIDTELTPLAIDGYEMVVRHRYVPFPSYPEEWCPAMLKDAALTIVEVLRGLVPYGLTLKDGHPWNVLFDTTTPLYVDLTSIVSITNGSEWVGYDEFCRFCLNPLVLMAYGQERIARRLLLEYEGVLDSDVSALARGPAVSTANLIKKALKPIRSAFPLLVAKRKSPLDFIEKIRLEIESIHQASCEASWAYCNWNSAPSRYLQDDWTESQKAVHRILTERRPGSVLAVGDAAGWYSRLAGLLGITVVAFATSSRDITGLYYDARESKSPVLPLVMDFTDPTPSRGLSSHWSIAASERFQCDMVLALDFVHRTVFKRHMNFDQIVSGLERFSKRSLVVEFVTGEDRDVSRWWSESFAWYTLDNFIKKLGERFPNVSSVRLGDKHRVVLVCEK